MRENWQLVISIFIAFILMFLIWSCGGTRKTDSSKTELSQSSINIENSYSMGSKIVLMDIFTAKPIDALKPMWIDGKEYKNAEISNDKSKIETKYFKVTEKIIIHTSRDVIKNKTATRTDNTILWLGMFLIVGCLVFLYFYLPKLKTGI